MNAKNYIRILNVHFAYTIIKYYVIESSEHDGGGRAGAAGARVGVRRQVLPLLPGHAAQRGQYHTPGVIVSLSIHLRQPAQQLRVGGSPSYPVDIRCSRHLKIVAIKTHVINGHYNMGV